MTLSCPNHLHACLCRWRDDPAVDPGAELERLVGCLPWLRMLTLPGEWAFGWGRPGSAAGRSGPAAAPLARLLLRRPGAPLRVHVLVPIPRQLANGQWARFGSIRRAAGKEAARQGWTDRLPHAECLFKAYEPADSTDWPGW